MQSRTGVEFASRNIGFPPVSNRSAITSPLNCDISITTQHIIISLALSRGPHLWPSTLHATE
jgi:hypothetical protein